MKQLVILLILTFPFFANAQYKIGYTSGVQLSGAIDQNDLFQLPPRLGYHFGLAIDINLFKDLSIEPMLLYSQKGYNESDNLGVEDVKVLHYISTQLVGKYHLLEEMKLIGGPEFSYLMHAKSQLSRQTITSEYNPLNISFFLGMELIFRDILSFNIKYNFGLNTLTEESVFDANGNNLGTTNVKTASIMYGITFYPFKSEKK